MIKYADFRLDCSTNVQYNSKIITKEVAETDSATKTLQSQKAPQKKDAHDRDKQRGVK